MKGSNNPHEYEDKNFKCINTEVFGDTAKLVVIEANKEFKPSYDNIINVDGGNWKIMGIALHREPLSPMIPSDEKSYWHLIVNALDEKSRSTNLISFQEAVML